MALARRMRQVGWAGWDAVQVQGTRKQCHARKLRHIRAAGCKSGRVG